MFSQRKASAVEEPAILNHCRNNTPGSFIWAQTLDTSSALSFSSTFNQIHLSFSLMSFICFDLNSSFQFPEVFL